MRLRSWKMGLATGVLAVAVVALYATRLSFAPIYLMHDESKFALQAQSIATTGRDMAGRRLPVYFTEPEFPAGRDPMIIYATALALKVLPLSEGAVRLPTALVGALDVLLMFVLSRRVFSSHGWGWVAAGLLALSPAHFIRSRLALSPQYSLPFILLWLIWLERFLADGRRRHAIVACAWLGCGIYSYLACMVMMPLYLALTLGLVWYRGTWRLAAAGGVAFIVTLLPIAAWSVAHPERYAQIVSAYRLGSTAASAPWGVGTASGILQAKLGLFWQFFNPEYLFLTGDSSLINSTRQAGLFPLAMAWLVPIGLYQVARGRRGLFGWIILAGFLTAPLATVLSGQIEMNRVLFVLPFGAVLATIGAHALVGARRSAMRWAGVVLIASVPVQFWGVYRDYMGPYRTASSVWFGGDLRSAIGAIVEGGAAAPPVVYISADIPYAERYWRFYTLAAVRPEMIGLATYVEEAAFDPEAAPGGAVAICRSGAGTCAALAVARDWTVVRDVVEPGGTHSFGVYAKRPH